MSVDKTRPPTFEEWAKEAKRLPKDTILKLWWEKIEECWRYRLSTECLGNSAKMREALKLCKSLFDDGTICTHYDSPAEDDDKLTDLKSTVEAALAAPARNCDRFGGDYKMLHTAWFDWTGSPSGQNPDGTVKLTFAKWLLAMTAKKRGDESPRTEHEGGAQ